MAPAPEPAGPPADTGWLVPEWPAPARVRAVSTTRTGGVSTGDFRSLNLAAHVGDSADAVAANRARLAAALALPAEPRWLEQVHGAEVADADAAHARAEADACVARRAGAVCAVLTADCLPVLLCDRAGRTVAAAHAGWRGLAAGVLEATVQAMDAPPETLLAWLGPAIGPEAFEVGPEVRAAFVAADAGAADAFRPAGGDRLWADLFTLARRRLARAGVRSVYGGGHCTFGAPERFFSYRREPRTGRMATLVWMADAGPWTR